jgi:hypothetical protein
MRGRVARFTAAFQALLLMATLLLPALVAATEITTDLWVYQNGDTVTVTGIDFGADEDVELVTTDPNGVEVDRGLVHSDANGSITYSFILGSDVPGIYDIVATGLTSGFSASTQFDPPSNISQTLSSTTITYGETTTSSGSLSASGSGLVGRTITFQTNTNTGCSSGAVAAGSTLTGALGAWSGVVIKPGSANVVKIDARFGGEGSGGSAINASDACTTIAVNKAPTATTGSTSGGSIYLTQSFTVDYEVMSAYGISGNTTTGGMSVVKDSGSGNLNCSATTPSISVAQANAAGSPANGGFDVTSDSTHRFTCTPDAAGSYTFHVAYAGDTNYLTSSSAANGLSVQVKNADATTLQLNLSPSPRFYGQGTAISGYLTLTTGGAGVSGAIVAVSTRNSSCGGGTSAYATRTTDTNCFWDTLSYGPTAVGAIGFQASYAGSAPTTGSSSAACQILTTSRAPTTSSGSSSSGGIYLTQSFTIDYEVSSDYGISPNSATGSMAVVLDSGPGSLGCVATTTAVSAAQGNADGSSPGSKAGFDFLSNGAHQFTCTPTAIGSYTYHVAFTDSDGNYANSNSSIGGLSVSVAGPNASSLSIDLNPSSILYGQSTEITGHLQDETADAAIISATVGGTRQTTPNESCGGSATSIGSDSTDGDGDYSLTYRPTTTETKDIKATYAATVEHAGATACATLTIDKAPTEIVNAILSDTTIGLSDSSFIDYKVQSAYGVLGNHANGTLSVVQDSIGGTLTCSATTTAVDRPEANADGTGALDAGFGLAVDGSTNTAYRFECTASANGTYLFHVHFTGDGDFAPSDSDTLTLVVSSYTPPTVDAGVDYTGNEGTSISLDGTVSDPDGDPLTYKWTIAYNVNMDPSGSCVFGNDSIVDTTLTCNDDSNGSSFTVTLTATGDPAGPVSDTASVTVANVAPAVSLSSGNSLTVTESTTAVVYTYTRSDAGSNDVLTSHPDCGSAGTLGAVTSTTFDCTFVDGGPAPAGTNTDVTIYVTDDELVANTSTTAKQAVNIANADPVVAAPSFSSTQVCQGSTATLTGIDFSDAGTVDYPWAISINWGDGSTNYSTNVNAQGPQSNVSPTYNTPGTYTATVTVTDKDGGSGSNTSSNQISVVAHYSITFLQPVDGTTTGAATNGVKLGRVVPVKILVRDNCANNFTGGWVTDPAAPVRLRASLSTNVNYTLLDSVEAYADAGSANNNTLLFRWTTDTSAPGGGFWIYNLDTKNSMQPKFELNKTYRIDATINGFLATGSTSQYALLVMQK